MYRLKVSSISIHAPRAGCDFVIQRHKFCQRISIHAPRAGCDGFELDITISQRNFNPRTPCGVRPAGILIQKQPTRFQSTHPVRGATPSGLSCVVLSIFQSTHPVRGATTFAPVVVSVTIFQSTHPVRGATLSNTRLSSRREISIHAPRAGCDDNFLQVLENDPFQSTHPVRGATSWHTPP